jgi:hypothetical protein
MGNGIGQKLFSQRIKSVDIITNYYARTTVIHEDEERETSKKRKASKVIREEMRRDKILLNLG